MRDGRERVPTACKLSLFVPSHAYKRAPVKRSYLVLLFGVPCGLISTCAVPRHLPILFSTTLLQSMGKIRGDTVTALAFGQDSKKKAVLSERVKKRKSHP